MAQTVYWRYCTNEVLPKTGSKKRNLGFYLGIYYFWREIRPRKSKKIPDKRIRTRLPNLERMG